MDLYDRAAYKSEGWLGALCEHSDFT